MKYEVVDPYNHIRISLDWERFAFDLDFKGRFAPFNYANSSPNGDPMRVFDEYYGGHFEQAMNCTGNFEIRAAGTKGETRKIDCWSHRDHTWTSRFNEPNSWKVQDGPLPGALLALDPAAGSTHQRAGHALAERRSRSASARTPASSPTRTAAARS